MAAKSVRSDAQKLPQLIIGRCPKSCINRFEIHSADIITIGTKLRYSTSSFGNVIFFNNKKGRTRDSQVTRPQPAIVNKIYSKEDTFHPHT